MTRLRKENDCASSRTDVQSDIREGDFHLFYQSYLTHLKDDGMNTVVCAIAGSSLLVNV